MTHEQRIASIQKVTIRASALQAFGTLLVILAAIGIWHKDYPEPANTAGFYVGGLLILLLVVTLFQQLVSQTLDTLALRNEPESLILAMYQDLAQQGQIAPKWIMSKTRAGFIIAVGTLACTWFFISLLR